MATFEDMDVAAALLALQRGLAPVVTGRIVLMTPLGLTTKANVFFWR